MRRIMLQRHATSPPQNPAPAAPRRRPTSRRPAARALLFILFCLLSLGGSILSVCTLGRSVYRWHGFAIELRLLPSPRGETRLVLMPLGEVRAHTHLAPIALIATLQELRIEEIQKLLNNPIRRDDLERDFKRSAEADLREFVARQFLAAALGALLAPLLLHSRRVRVYLGSGLIGTLGVAIVLGNALSTFDGKAFNSVTYTGALKQAPWVIRLGKNAFSQFDTLSQKLRMVASNLNVLYGRIERLPITQDDGPDTFHILHVSDIHDNLTAMPFISQVAEEFKVEMIVDTGDLTDYGNVSETSIARDIAKLHRPYVFALGNHDSRAVAHALEKVPQVTLLNGQVATVGDLTLLGLPNPAAARDGVGNVVANPAALQAGAATLLNTVSALPVPPDIVAVHDPIEAKSLWGRVPVILCGHLHRAYVETQPPSAAGAVPGNAAPGAPSPDVRAAYSTVVCNAGTTGAAGLRYFNRPEGVPYTCAVLTFQRPHAPAPASQGGATVTPAPRPQLRAIDIIELNGAFDEYSISHYAFKK